MKTVSTEDVREKIDNGDAAIVNVLSEESFQEEHIPTSINIPRDDIDEFEERFDKDEEIIVYCASESCSASPKAAEELESRGFENVKDYEGGMATWRDAGQPVES